MVLCHHQIAQAIEIGCKFTVTLNIFRNAVDDLEHCLGAVPPGSSGSSGADLLHWKEW